MSDERRWRGRRRFLRAAGIGVGGALAGCLGGDGGDGASDGESGGESNGGSDGGSGSGEIGTTTASTDEADFPSRDLRLVIPFGPGGGYDAYARFAAKHLEKHLPGDHSVNVQNVEGAGGAIAAEEVYNAEPDGHTLMIVSITGFSLEQMYRDVDFDLGKMTYLAQVAFEPHMLGVGNETDVTNWDDFVSAMQTDKPPRMYSSSAVSVDVAGPVLLGALGDLWEPEKVVNSLVIYDSRGAALQGILAGDLEYMSTAYSSVLEYKENLTSPIIYAREENKPANVPDGTQSLTEAGLPEGIEGMVGTRRAFAGPPEIPEDRVETLRTAFAETIQNDAEFQADLDNANRPINYLGGEEVGTIAADAIATWQEHEVVIESMIQGEE